jgi:signal transduction histidine kinase
MHLFTKFRKFISDFKIHKELRYSVVSYLIVSTFICGLTIASYYSNYQIQKEEVENVSRALVKGLNEYIHSLIHKSDAVRGEGELELNTQVKNSKRKLSKLEKSKILAEVVEKDEDIGTLAVTTAEGYIIANSEWAQHPDQFNSQLNINISQEKEFVLLKGDPKLHFVISKPHFSETSGELVIDMSERLYHENHQFIGIIFTSINLEKLSEYFKMVNPYPESKITLLSNDNTIYANSPFSKSSIGSKIPINKNLSSPGLGKKTWFSFSDIDPLDGKNKVYSYSQVGITELGILWELPQTKIFAKLNTQYIWIAILELFILFMTGLLLALTYKNILKGSENEVKEIRMARLSTVAEISNSVAHEVKNPLAIIVGKINLALKRAKTISPADENMLAIIKHLEHSKESAFRISKIISSLENLGQDETDEKLYPSSLGSIVEEAVSLVRDSMGHDGVRIDLNIPPEMLALSRHQELIQILLSLLSNSHYAIKGQEVAQGAAEPWIRIEAQYKDPSTKDNIVLRFSDSGLGIPVEIRSKIFNPFFTTKAAGVGTGLGLTVARKCIESIGGQIVLDEEYPNTSFLIEIKCAEKLMMTGEKKAA